MPQKKRKPEEIVAKLRQVDGLAPQGRPVAEAIRTISVAPLTCYRWRKEFGGLKSDQVSRLKNEGGLDGEGGGEGHGSLPQPIAVLAVQQDSE